MTVRLLLWTLLLPALPTGAQPAPAPVQGVPRIGIVDFYGLKNADKERVLRALEVKPGDPLPRSKGETEERMELVNNVVRANLEAVCCAEGNAILYVGILERGAPTFHYRDAPADETLRLPEPLVDLWQRFWEQLQAGVRQGVSEEDLTNGHSLMKYAPARTLQLQFPALVDAHLPVIRKVLRESVDETERAIAAYAIAYASKKASVLNDLQYAVQDPDDGVRNNAMRSLAAFSVLAKLKPESGLRIEPTWFIEQLNSLIWSDRNKAAYALVPLTEDRPAETLTLLRDRALDAMTDMARWRHLPHALPGFILLARSAGWEEKQIQDTWAAGTHLAAVDAILKEFAAAKAGKKD